MARVSPGSGRPRPRWLHATWGKGVQHWLAWPAHHRRAALITLASYPWIAAGVKRLGYAWTLRAARVRACPGGLHWPGETSELAEVVARVTGGLAARDRCLARSLTLWHVLHWHGIAGHIKFGARVEGSELAAHAWVEVGGLQFGAQAGAFATLRTR